ncbi:elongation factor G, partial [bacterium]|nr:elongation factor G [bacterium]
IDTVSEQSDEITEKYLSGEEISEDEIREAIRKGVISLSFVPVLCGSSLKNKGVQPLLDAVVYYLPSPLDVPPVKGIHPVTNKVIERHASSKEPFSALVYKIQSDPFGKLTYIRVYSGTISAGSTVYNVRTKKRERFNRIIRLHADHREDVDSASAGDLYAVVGLKNVSTGDSLCDDKNPILLERIVFPEPVISVSIEASTRAEQEKLSDALTKLGEEDPTFKVSTDEETGQILISGMGELHLEIIIDRIINEFKVDASVGKPQVSYRESMRKISEGEGIFEKQISGKTIFGHVKITLEPSDEPSKIIFENELKNEEIPKTFIPFVEQGVKDALETGVMIGYPVIGIKAKLIGGTFREMESTDLAFKVASSMAVREAMAKNETFLMEPIMKVDVETPEEYLGEVIADLNSRRGRVEKMESTQIGIQQVEASVPLANMFGYATELRSLTQGRAVFSSEFMKYGEVPSNIQSEIMTRVLGYTV